MNTDSNTSRSLSLEPNDSHKLVELCGHLNEHIKLLESRFHVEILSRGNRFEIRGKDFDCEQVTALLNTMYRYCFRADKEILNPEIVHLLIQEKRNSSSQRQNQSMENNHSQQSDSNSNETDKPNEESLLIETPRKTIETRGKNQCQYLKKIEKHDINFGIGPAGTGKTYLAVACAVAALKQEQVNRIVLVRPAVEAGEKLGFLPGDLNEKVDPYLRPLYDALYEMLGFETVDKMLEKQIIEIAPLAYMRGRTLNNAFIILDESQNTTREQMKMFLTRIGFGAKAVITGDVTQVDLPKGSESGLAHATQVLKDIKQIGFTHFNSKDVVRHRLVQKIIEAYSEHEKNSTIEAVPQRSEKVQKT